MKTTVSVIAFLVMSASAAYASGPTGTKTFQGLGFVEAVNSTCATDGFAVGDYYTAVYRYRVDSSATVYDAFDLFPLRAAFHILANNASGSLNGATATTNAIIDSHGGLSTGLAGSTSFSIASAGGLATASAINLKVVGTIDNFFDNPGCTVTFHANMVARPD